MAFAARLSELTEELIAVITLTSRQSDPERVNVLRESSLRKLRHHNFLRTNQFNVEDHLDGIEERFWVLNRDGLANALRESLDALSLISTKFTPDTLHFLLELSDQPVQKSKIADLKLLRQPEEDPGPPLKWEEIAREDGWATERDLWKKVDFADGGSDDGYEVEKSTISVASEDTSLSSLDAQYRPRPTDYLVKAQDEGILKSVQDSHLWRNATPSKNSTGRLQKIVISETHLVREVLFMLNGLQNSLFGPQGEPSTKYRLEHASWESYRALVGSFGEAGRHLSILRVFVRQSQQIPLMQVFKDAVQKRLRCFDGIISHIQENFVNIKQDTVVSAIRVLREVQPQLKPLLFLSEIIQQLELEKYSHPFRYLELLFDAAGMAQLDGNDQIYDFLGTILCECFRVYLRPVRRWMEEGELSDSDTTFFVSKSNTQLPLSRVWHDQFNLRITPDGTLHAPSFLQPATSKIFKTGKSVVVLKLLGRHEIAAAQTQEPPLDFQSLGASGFGNFAPFSAIFNEAFDRWMQSKHHAASAILRFTLFESCGLWSVLDVFQHIYLMSNGSRSDVLAFAIFNNIDLLNPRWHDRFTLTEQAQEAFHNLVDSHRVAISVSEEEVGEDIAVARRSVQKCLPAIKVIYRMTWPLRMIVSEESIAKYQALFTWLLQLRRATYVLRRHRLASEGMTDSSPEQATYYGLRTKLLWFCSNFQSYLSNVVIAPLTNELLEALRTAEDVDRMITCHSAFAKRLLDESCLGSKLDPIQQCILDMLDLAIRLEDSCEAEAERAARETQNPKGEFGTRDIYMKDSEEEEKPFLIEQEKIDVALDPDKTYAEVLRGIRTDFDKHLRFICGGLRGVARASGDVAARKWDTLAEMLEAGIRENAW